MKRKLSVFLTIAALATGLSQFAFAADQTRAVSGYTGVASSGSFAVHIKIDGSEGVKIVADDELIDKIETVVEHGLLNIRLKRNTSWSDHNYKKAEIYVSAKSLNSLVNSGSGSIKLDGTLNSGNVNVVLSGSGSISAGVKAGKSDLTISGSGSVDLSGSSSEAHIAISGSGSLHAKELKTETTDVSISGSGDVYINSEKELSASIIGSGSVRYTGNASVHTSKMGSGSVTKG